MPNNKNEDIEELRLDDVEFEMKIDEIKIDKLEVNPTDSQVEKLDFDTDSNKDTSAVDSLDNQERFEPTDSNVDSESNDDIETLDDGELTSDTSDDKENDTSTVSEGDSPSKTTPSEDVEGGSQKDTNAGTEDGNSEANTDDKSAENDGSTENKISEDQKNGEDASEDNKENIDNNSDKISDEKNPEDKPAEGPTNGNGPDSKEDKPREERKDGSGNNSDNNNLGDKSKDNRTDNTRPDGNRNKPGQNKNRSRDNKPKSEKDFGKRAKNRVTNAAKNKLTENSRAGQAVNKAQDVANKVKTAGKVISKIASFFTTPLGLGILIGLGLFLVIMFVSVLIASGSPGAGGEVENEENYSKYSEVDQKTINKLRDIYNKYPTGEPEYAMAATLYPYIEEMQNGNVGSLRGKTNQEQEDDEDIMDESEKAENETDNIDDNKDDTTPDDMYLELLRDSTYYNKFKKLLKESRNGEEALTSYLKGTYFKKDKGYKELFDGAEDREELENAIIDDLLNQKSDFEAYFFDNKFCSVNMASIGTVEVDELLKGNILVDVKVESCTTGNINGCESKYPNPISMEKYIMGVTYEEIGVNSGSDIEKVKAQMVAAKSYAIGRSFSMGWDIKQTSDGAYVIQIRSNTNDQDYCDIDTGCQDKINGAKRNPIDSATRALMSEAWEATKNVYIYNTETKKTVGAFCQSRTGVCSFCSKGSCLAHEELSSYRSTKFDKILGDQYSSYAVITIQGDYADASIASGETCAVNGIGIPDDEFKFYYQLDYASVPFCGATNHLPSCASGANSICTAGCGVTSLAMLVANLSNDTAFDPVAANSEAYADRSCAVGVGSYDTVFTNIGKNHAGFTYEKLPNTTEGVTKAIAAIRDGGLVVADVQANSPFTSGGHWIVLRGITEDGMVKVADPNSRERSATGTYNINDFIDKNWLNGHSWYAIYGPKSPEIKAMNDAMSEQGVAGEIIDTANGIRGTFFAPVQNDNLKMYGKNLSNGYKNHDLGATCGSAVYSPVDGEATFKTITKNGKIASYGNEVEIKTADGYRIVLSHLKSFVGYNVKYGTDSTYPSSCSFAICSTHTYGTRNVKAGEKLGLSGTSGNSTGCHLHIEVWKGSTRLEPSSIFGYGVR